MAVAGVVMAKVGLQPFFVGMGAAVVVLAPLISLIPHICLFFDTPLKQGEKFFAETYPGAFRD